MSLSLLRFTVLAPHDAVVRHGIFSRHGGVSAPPFQSLNVSYSVGDDLAAVVENRARCAAAVDVALTTVTTAGLVHGAAAAVLDRLPAETLPDGSRIVPDVDALVT